MNDQAPRPSEESEPKGLGTASCQEVHSQEVPTAPTYSEEQAEPSGIAREASRRSLFRRALSRRSGLRPSKSLGSEDFSKLIGDIEPLQIRSLSCDNLAVDISDEIFGPKEAGDTDSSPEIKTDRGSKSKSSTRRALKVLKKVSKSTRNMLGKPSTSSSNRGENVVDELNNSSIHSFRSQRTSQPIEEQSRSDGKGLLAKSLDRWGSSHGPGRDQSKRGTLKKTPSSRRGLFSSKQPFQGNESTSDMSSFSLFSTQSDEKYCALDGSMSSFAEDSNPSLLSQEVKETLSVSKGLSIDDESQCAPAQFRIDAPSFSCLSLSDEEMTIHELKDDPVPGMFIDGESDDSNKRHHSAPTLLEHQVSWEVEVPIYLSENEDIAVSVPPAKPVDDDDDDDDDDDNSIASILTKGNGPDAPLISMKYYSSPQRDNVSVPSKASRSRQQNGSTPVLREFSSNRRRSKVSRTKTTQRTAAEPGAPSLQRERSGSQRTVTEFDAQRERSGPQLTVVEPDSKPMQRERCNSSDQSSRDRSSSKSQSGSKSKNRSASKRKSSSKSQSGSKSSSSSRRRSSSKTRQERVCSEAIESSNGRAQRRRSSEKDERSQSARRERTYDEDDTHSCDDDSDYSSSIHRRRRSKSKDLDDSLHRSKHRSSSRRCDPTLRYALPIDYRVREDSVRRTKSEGLPLRKPHQRDTVTARPDQRSQAAQSSSQWHS